MNTTMEKLDNMLYELSTLQAFALIIGLALIFLLIALVIKHFVDKRDKEEEELYRLKRGYDHLKNEFND